MKIVTLNLADLHVTRTLQPRGGQMCADTVREYAAAAKEGAAFPRLVAYEVTDRAFKKPALVAGFHRYDGYKAAGVEAAEVEVHAGTFAEAWLAGYRSNLTNGLRYDNVQKRAAVETALMLFRSDSAPALADRLGVSDQFVRNVRAEMVRLGKIDQPAIVKGKDGREQSATKGKSNKDILQVPTVGTCTGSASESEGIETVSEVSDDEANDGSSESVPSEAEVSAAGDVEDDDDSPRDWVHVSVLERLERECADRGDYQGAEEYAAEAKTLRGELTAKPKGGNNFEYGANEPAGKPCAPSSQVQSPTEANDEPGGGVAGFDYPAEPYKRLPAREPDPPGPFDELLSHMTGLSRRLTLAINDPTTDGERLKSYLSAVGLVFHQDKVIDGRRYRAAFTGLRGIRWVVRLANRGGPPLAPAKIKAGYLEALGEDDE